MQQMVSDFQNQIANQDQRNLYDFIKRAAKPIYKNGRVDAEAILTIIEALVENTFVADLGPTTNFYLERYFGYKPTKTPSGPIPDPADVQLAEKLKVSFENHIRQVCHLKKECYGRVLDVYRDFFAKLSGRIQKQNLTTRDGRICEIPSNLPIYTTNYDLCVERFFEVDLDYKGLKMGFEAIGSESVLNPRSLQGDSGIKLVKLHGSINWRKKGEDVIRVFESGESFLGREYEGELMLFPIKQKTNYLSPYFDFLAALKKDLLASPRWIIIGYAFNDDVIRDIFVEASRPRRPTEEAKKVVIVHPADFLLEERLQDLEGPPLFLQKKFGEDDFQQVNQEIVDLLMK